MNQLIQFKTTTLSFLIAFLLSCVALLPKVQALAPPADGGYPGENTAEGTGALNSFSPQFRGFGVDNTALGFHTLYSDTSGSYNTATGAFALGSNKVGLGNTAVGYQAAVSNVGGVFPNPPGADFFGGRYNTAIGFEALLHNVNGSDNTAVGSKALTNNLANPPLFPGVGSSNTAVGSEALYSNTDGNQNTAIGAEALYNNITGGGNTAIGIFALSDSTGHDNIAVGLNAGSALTTGGGNIYIGNAGVSEESSTIRIGTQGTHMATLIAGIYGTPITGGVPVVVNGNGQLGVAAIASSSPNSRSTRRLKREILRYEAMNTKLRSDLVKEHRKVEEQQATITELKKEMKAIVVRVNEQESRIQRVSAELELRKAAPQMVVDN
jgi:hypothetical protein